MATGDFPQTPWITEQDRGRTFSGGDPFGTIPEVNAQRNLMWERIRDQTLETGLIERLIQRIERLEAEVARMKEE